MKKKILILSDKNDWKGDQPDFANRHRFSYGVWGDYCNKNKIQLLKACWGWFNKNNFDKCWRYDDKGKWEKNDKNIIPNVVYDKCANMIFGTKNDRRVDIYKMKREISSTYKFVNCVEFNDLFTSKLNQAIIFKDFIPRTRVVKRGELVNNPK